MSALVVATLFKFLYAENFTIYLLSSYFQIVEQKARELDRKKDCSYN